VLVDPVSLPFLAGARIDFSDELIGARFVIDNPNANPIHRVPADSDGHFGRPVGAIGVPSAAIVRLRHASTWVPTKSSTRKMLVQPVISPPGPGHSGGRGGRESFREIAVVDVGIG
jgi:hypothetical protein